MQAPAKVHAAAKDAGIRTRRVHKCAVESDGSRRPHWWQRSGDSFNTVDSESAAVFLEELEPRRRFIRSHDAARVVHARGDGGGFAARSRAQVENGFTGLRGELGNGGECARILNVKAACDEALEAGEARRRLEKKHRILPKAVAPDEVVFHALDAPLLEQSGGVSAECVHSREDRGRCVIPFEEPRGILGTPATPPATREPFGMRPSEMGLGHFEFGQRRACRGGFSRVRAEQTVDESRLRAAVVSLGELDGFVHGSVRRDAVEAEELVEAESQQELHIGQLRAAASVACDEPVERGLPANDTEGEFLAQGTIKRRKMHAREPGFEQILRECTASVAVAEHFERELARGRSREAPRVGVFSWFLKTHAVTIPDPMRGARKTGAMREEFEKLAAAGKISTKHIEPLVQLAKGGYCTHRSWGFGRITTVDTVFARFTIDFQTKAGHSMDLTFAAESLKAIPREHILARKASDLGALRQMAALHHLDLIKLVLESFGGKATLDQIQQVLVPDVITSDYKKWLEVAKREMKKDGHFVVPLKKTEPVVYQVAEVSLKDRLLAEFRAAKGLKARLVVAAELLKGVPDFTDAADACREAVALLNSEIASHQRTQPALALEAVFMRDDLRLAANLAPDAGDLTPDSIWQQAPRLSQLLELLPAAKHKRALQSLQAANPEWADAVLDILNSVTAKTCSECASALIHGERMASLKDRLARLISQHQASSELLLWLAKERSDTFADILGPEVFRAMLTAIERDQFNEKKSNRLRDFIMGDQQLLVELIESADIEVIKDLTRALQLSPSFDDMDKRSLLARIVKAYPVIQSLITGDQHTKHDSALVVSWDSLERRRNEYTELVQKKIPANSKDIAIARSYGDLRENHEYKAAKEMHRVLMRRKHELENQLVRARGTDFADTRTETVGVGTRVRVTELNTHHPESYSVLGAWDFDAEHGIVSYLSPLAQALMNHAVGDEVDFELDGVKKRYRVDAIEKVVGPAATSAAGAPAVEAAPQESPVQP